MFAAKSPTPEEWETIARANQPYFVRDRTEIRKHIRQAHWVYVSTSFGENARISKRVAIDLLKSNRPIVASIHPGHRSHVFLHKDTGDDI